MNAPARIDFAALMPKVAPLLLGKPNERMSKGTRLRFGTNGSMEIDTGEGWFDDHEGKARGGVLELIQHKRRCNMREALSWLEDQGLKDNGQPQARTSPIFYDYDDPDTGEIAFRVERRGKGMSPPFLQHGPDGRGGFHAARGCMAGVKRLPYRASALRAAPADAIVFVVEGEKDADRLIAAGLTATTNSGGAGKFGPELVPYFTDRRVVIIPDNDQPGQDHAADVAGKLAGAAKTVAILPLSGGPKSDVSDWLAQGGSAPELVQKAEAALAAASEQTRPETFPTADLLAWARTAPEPKAFTMAGFIPTGEVTLFTGAGGTNKSTFGLQLCAASAVGKAMLGADVAPGPALYVTAEDEDRENHWRLGKIAHAIGTRLERLAGRLHVVSLRGRLNNELATFDGEGRLHAAPAYALLRATIQVTGSKLIVLDNVAHLFAGNENDRQQVTAFVNLLYQLCRDLGCTVVLIGHPNKVGDSYSGSTAWLNAVRSQIVLAKPEDSHDPDARLLTLGKANYARADRQIAFRWHDFALVRDEDLPANVGAEIAANVQASHDNAVFLTCLEERNKQERAVSESPASRTFAPRVFAEMTESKRIGRARLEAAMDRLFRIGAIQRGVVGRHRAEGKDMVGLRRTSDDLSDDLPMTGSDDLPMTTRRPPTAHTPSTTYYSGAATSAAAPILNGKHHGLRRGPILAPEDLADGGMGGLNGWPVRSEEH